MSVSTWRRSKRPMLLLSAAAKDKRVKIIGGSYRLALRSF